MAWQDRLFTLTLTFQDAQADRVSRRYELQAANYADAASAALVVIGYLEDVTAADIVKYEVTQTFEADDASLPAGTDVSQGALIAMRINGQPSKTATASIPAPAAGIFTATTGEDANKVDPNDAAVIAFWGMFTPDGECFISDGEEVQESGGFLYGYRTPRKGGHRI